MATCLISKKGPKFNPHSSEMRRRCLIAGDLPPPRRDQRGVKWLPVLGYEGYEVSDLGEIKSKRQNPSGHILNGATNAAGYRTVKLYVAGKSGPDTLLVHHIVACHWHSESYKEGLTVTHLNSVKTDNRSINLAWRSHHENMRDKVALGRTNQGEKNSFSRLKEHEVLAIRASSEATSILAKRFSVDSLTVTRARRRESWKHLP